MEEEKKEKKGKIEKALDKSPINYFSDLFIAAMVVAWIIVIIIMVAAAIYATVIFQDTSIWCEVGSLVAVPLSCGGAIWMLKNSVQHAIANHNGKECPPDFPAVNDSMDIDGQEEPMTTAQEEDSEEEMDIDLEDETINDEEVYG